MSLIRPVRPLGTLFAAVLTLTLSAAGSLPAGAVGTVTTATAASACLSTQSKPSSPLAACATADTATSEATVALPVGSTTCASTASKPSSDTATCSGAQASGATAALSTFVLKLGASPVSVAPGGTTTLTATSNQDVGPTPFFIQIFDATAGAFITSCGGGTTCATSVTQSGSTVRNYVAFVTDSGKTFPPPSPQTTSNTVTVSWLTISLTASPLALQPGGTTTLTATASLDVGPTPFFIEIFDVTAGTLVVECGFGATCAGSVTQSGSAVRSYTAFVSDLSATLPPPGIRAQSTSVLVTWITVSLTASPTVLPAGISGPSISTLTATASLDVRLTQLAIMIFDKGANFQLAGCTGGTTCITHVGIRVPSQHTYIALVTTSITGTLPPASDIRAASNEVSVTWTATSATVPNVVGLSESQATDVITAAGLVASVGHHAFCIDPGNVRSQDPVAGSVVPIGSTVSITVDSGTPDVCIIQ